MLESSNKYPPPLNNEDEVEGTPAKRKDATKEEVIMP